MNILFVCTGNVCRSPMAEALFRKRVVSRPDWQVSSAGTSTIGGMPASAQSVTAVAERGVDLAEHRSRPVTAELVDQSYIIIVMTRGHRDMLLAQWPAAADKVYLLMEFAEQQRGQDVPDPIGYPVDVYRSTRNMIECAFAGLEDFLDRQTHTR